MERQATDATVFGAGSVGTVLAACLAGSGVGVALMGRGAKPGLRIEGDDERVEAEVEVVDRPHGVLFLCVHQEETGPLARRFAGEPMVSFCNGVQTFPGVVPGIWRMTCTLVEPGLAHFTRRGRIILGASLGAGMLRAAGFDVAVSGDIGADRWLKLFCNLASTVNALVRAEDHHTPAFGTAKALLLEEARAVFSAAGIRAGSCDGKDCSLEQEIERQRAGGGRSRKVYNDTWRQLSLGRRPKERYHEVVCGLGPAPANAVMQKLLDEAGGPECYLADELLAMLLSA